MSKYVYAGLMAVAIAGLVLAAGCKGGGGHAGHNEACSASGGCGGCGDMGGCGGCSGKAAGGGCGDMAACGGCSGKAACGGCGGCSGKAACGGCSGKAACGGCGGCGGGATVSSADARQAMRLASLHTRWQKKHKEPVLSKQHMRHKVVSYADARASAIYDSGQGAYPQNAALAKEGYKNGELKVIWLMQKRAKGYDPANGDWWYATVSAKGKVMNAGKVEMCIDCHSGADNDYVFGQG